MRTLTNDDRCVVATFSVPLKVLRRVDREAAARGQTRSRLLRGLIDKSFPERRAAHA